MANEYQIFLNKLYADPKFKKEAEKLNLPLEIAETIIDVRVNLGMTQLVLAKKIGTKQSGIARIESGHHFSSLATLNKIAKVLGLGLRNPLYSNSTDNLVYRYIFVKGDVSEDFSVSVKSRSAKAYAKLTANL